MVCGRGQEWAQGGLGGAQPAGAKARDAVAQAATPVEQPLGCGAEESRSQKRARPRAPPRRSRARDGSGGVPSRRRARALAGLPPGLRQCSGAPSAKPDALPILAAAAAAVPPALPTPPMLPEAAAAAPLADTGRGRGTVAEGTQGCCAGAAAAPAPVPLLLLQAAVAARRSPATPDVRHCATWGGRGRASQHVRPCRYRGTLLSPGVPLAWPQTQSPSPLGPSCLKRRLTRWMSVAIPSTRSTGTPAETPQPPTNFNPTRLHAAHPCHAVDVCCDVLRQVHRQPQQPPVLLYQLVARHGAGAEAAAVDDGALQGLLQDLRGCEGVCGSVCGSVCVCVCQTCCHSLLVYALGAAARWLLRCMQFCSSDPSNREAESPGVPRPQRPTLTVIFCTGPFPCLPRTSLICRWK